MTVFPEDDEPELRPARCVVCGQLTIALSTFICTQCHLPPAPPAPEVAWGLDSDGE